MLNYVNHRFSLCKFVLFEYNLLGNFDACSRYNERYMCYVFSLKSLNFFVAQTTLRLKADKNEYHIEISNTTPASTRHTSPNVTVLQLPLIGVQHSLSA